jgi:DNA polymerase-3 subunit gamma/tau
MSDTDLTLETEAEARPDERDEATVDIFGQAASAPPEPAPAYTVIARKYRPRTFSDLIGQEAMVRTLTNAFATGRIAHAFMLTGVRGVGKTTTARLLARALAVEGVHCRAIQEGRHLDVLEIDAASNNGVENMRELTEAVRYAPAQARYKIYILDEVHMLSTPAFNALLKTLEEPPPHVKFIFATTEIRKVPVTILSRCQRFDLRRVEPEVIAANLAAIARAEGVAIEAEALTLIGRAAEGSVRDAQSLLDQALVQAGPGETVDAARVRDMLGLSDRALTIGLIELVARGEAGAAIEAFRDLFAVGADPAVLVMDLLEHCHGATLAKTLGPEALRLPKDQAARLTALGASLSAGVLSRLWQMLLKGLDEVRAAPDPAAAVDMLLVRLAYAADLPGPEAALEALRADPAGSGAGASGGSPRRPGGSGGSVAALAERPLEAAPRARSLTEPTSFEDLSRLAEARRDIALKFDLDRYARPISFRTGAIEFEPAPGAPTNLAQRLASRLKEWTGQPWLVAAQHGGGARTLAETQRHAAAKAQEAALADPFVKAILEAFPGTEVTEVRQMSVELGALQDAENDEDDT